MESSRIAELEAACAAKDEALEAILPFALVRIHDIMEGWGTEEEGKRAEEARDLAHAALSASAGRAYAEYVRRLEEAAREAEEVLRVAIEEARPDRLPEVEATHRKLEAALRGGDPK
ncbi:MAG: hypothetical protein AB1760_00110 [Pseudomonadota bacterium]